MTRFRAYATDSEEQSSSDESIQDNQRRSDSGRPAAQQRSVVIQRSRNPPSESGDSDMYTDPEPAAEEEQAEGEEGENSSLSSGSPSGHPARLPDSSLTPWAREVGVDRQKMHVMQASLFRAPEEAAAMQSLEQQEPPRRRLLPPSTIGRKHSRDSDGEGLRADSRQRTSFAHDIDPAPFRPSRKYARVSTSASAVTGHEDALVDSGLAFGRSFRVGWGPGGAIVHLGTLCAPWDSPTSTANSSVVTVSTLPTIAANTEDASEYASKLLSYNLTHTVIEPDADGVPCAVPSRQLTFSSFAGLFPPTDVSFEPSLFRLGHALFDPIDLHLADEVDDEMRTSVHNLRRKAALSKWLQNAVAPIIEEELEEAMSGERGWTLALFALLTGNQVEKASELAVDSSNVKLATLLCQAGGDAEFREDLCSQLGLWREQKIDVHIDVNIRKVYALLAGIVDILEGSKGTGLERCPDVIVSKGLDWKRVFGLHLWFGQPMDASIADSFLAYDTLVKAHASHVAPPVPWYREPPMSNSSVWTLPPETDPPDALFSLIKLFADPESSLSHVLAPFSFSPSPSDYRLSWHLYILLSRCLHARDFDDRGDAGVDGRHSEAEERSDDGVEGHSPSADLLASSYALQLEEMGMVQEAVFVLLHLEGSSGRKRAIKEMLTRNAPKLDEWMMRGLVGSLKIPMAWVNEAKAIYALNNGDVYEAYELFLMAGMYTAAHDLAVLDLAPDAIIRKDLELLKELLQRIAGHPVDTWHTRGKVFLDYVNVMTRLPELRDRLDITEVAPDPADAAEIDELTRSVPKLITLLPDILYNRSDIRHNAALAEMITGLSQCLDQLRPLALGQHLRTSKVPEATKLAHIRAAAYEKFLRSIEVV